MQDTNEVPTTPSQRASGGGLGTGAIIVLVVALILALGIGIFAGWAVARSGSTSSSTSTGSSSAATEQDTVRINTIQQFQPSVVQINISTAKGAGGLGSGTIIDSRGYIVTNYHVIAGATGITVELYDGTILPAKLTGIDPLDDLAVVQITPPPHMAVAKIGDSSKLQVGQTVIAIGNPLGITQTVTSGIVSALGRNVPAGEGSYIFNSIQMDTAINPGNSGGALVDFNGELIGVPTLTIISPQFNAPASGVGFAIPSTRVSFIVPQLIQSGKVTDSGLGDMGIEGSTVTPRIAFLNQFPVTQGVLIDKVTSGGPADQAGLKVGNIIVQIDNVAVTNFTAFNTYVMSKQPGTQVTVHFYQGNQLRTATVTLGTLQLP